MAEQQMQGTYRLVRSRHMVLEGVGGRNEAIRSSYVDSAVT